jgi:hypothetical protein
MVKVNSTTASSSTSNPQLNNEEGYFKEYVNSCWERCKRAINTDVSDKEEFRKFHETNMHEDEESIKKHPVASWFDGTRIDYYVSKFILWTN